MSISRRKLVLTGGSAATLSGLPWASAAETKTKAADLFIFGGPIVTVNDAQPSAEAVAVKDGKIVAVGVRNKLQAKWVGPKTRVVDLAGKTLGPGFIDGHGHFMNAPRIIQLGQCFLGAGRAGEGNSRHPQGAFGPCGQKGKYRRANGCSPMAMTGRALPRAGN